MNKRRKWERIRGKRKCCKKYPLPFLFVHRKEKKKTFEMLQYFNILLTIFKIQLLFTICSTSLFRELFCHLLQPLVFWNKFEQRAIQCSTVPVSSVSSVELAILFTCICLYNLAIWPLWSGSSFHCGGRYTGLWVGL